MLQKFRIILRIGDSAVILIISDADIMQYSLDFDIREKDRRPDQQQTGPVFGHRLQVFLGQSIHAAGPFLNVRSKIIGLLDKIRLYCSLCG